MKKEKQTLSIFVDESGDFGPYNPKSPFYLFTLLFHNQSIPINKKVQQLNIELGKIGEAITYFHTVPLFRGKEQYCGLDIKNRRSIFNKMSFFVNHLEINYSTIIVNKKFITNNRPLEILLLEETKKVFENLKTFFNKFDEIKVYYDNGQKQLSKILNMIFTIYFEKFEKKVVSPEKYKLFQTADFITTLELINLKFSNNITNRSEKFFFGSKRHFNKNYFRKLRLKKLSNN